jgi:hypothetical protein
MKHCGDGPCVRNYLTSLALEDNSNSPQGQSLSRTRLLRLEGELFAAANSALVAKNAVTRERYGFLLRDESDWLQ